MRNKTIGFMMLLLICCSLCYAAHIEEISVESDKIDEFTENVFRKTITPEKKDLGRLSAEALRKELSDILTSNSFNESASIDNLIKNYEHIEPTLVAFLDNPHIRANAALLLLELGNDSIADLVISKANSLNENEFKQIESLNCGALVSPKNDKQWDFMRRCLSPNRKSGGDSYLPVQNCGLALGANNDPKSLEILKSYQKKQGEETHWCVKNAIAFKNINPSGVAPDKEINIAIRNVLPVFLDEKRQKAAKFSIKYNNKQNIAIVELSVILGPLSGQGYRLVLTKSSDLWALKCIWATWIS